MSTTSNAGKNDYKTIKDRELENMKKIRPLHGFGTAEEILKQFAERGISLSKEEFAKYVASGDIIHYPKANTYSVVSIILVKRAMDLARRQKDQFTRRAQLESLTGMAKDALEEAIQKEQFGIDYMIAKGKNLFAEHEIRLLTNAPPMEHLAKTSFAEHFIPVQTITRGDGTVYDVYNKNTVEWAWMMRTKDIIDTRMRQHGYDV